MEHGLLGLFIVCFLAATILPFSSELVLAAMANGDASFASLLIAASLGNWLGGMSSYALGWFGRSRSLEQWIERSPEKRGRWFAWTQRQGHWVALLCWLPVVGDLIAIALGLSRSKVIPVAAFMLIGKAIRYVVVLAMMRGLIF